MGNHVDPLTDQQLIGICNLQQSSQQAEDALSQGMEALQQSLLETLSSASMGPNSSANVADYMGHMAMAMGKLGTLENFLRQVRNKTSVHNNNNWHYKSNNWKGFFAGWSIEATDSPTASQNSYHTTSCSRLFGHPWLYFSA